MKKYVILMYFAIILFSLIKLTLNKANMTFNEITSNYEIFIELEDSTLHLFENNILLKSYKIAGGKADTPSPIGIWKIDYKSMWGEGFGGRFMRISVPWGTFGIHGTNYPSSIGKLASHGCIRMNNSDIAQVYSIVPIGTTVIISNGINGAFYTQQRTILPGNTGSDVLAVQYMLKKLGFYFGAFDGKYGLELEKALNNYQKSNGFDIKNTINQWDLQVMGFKKFE